RRVLLVGSVLPGAAVPVLQRVRLRRAEVAARAVQINAHVLDRCWLAEIHAEPIFVVAGAERGPAAGRAVLVIENLSINGLTRAALRPVVVGDGHWVAVSGEVGGGVDPRMGDVGRELLCGRHGDG